MKTSVKNIDEIFTFEGEWGVESKCGLKIVKKDDMATIIVTELYQDNPGSSVTSVAASLAKQVCDNYSLSYKKVIYIESTPEMHSKLNFYDENYYKVDFIVDDSGFKNPKWSKLEDGEIEKYV